MTVTQCSTNTYGVKVTKTVPTAVYMSGVHTMEKTGATHRGFEGFGVAITGSSCWNLMQMEAGERHAFLKSIYGKNGLGLTTARLTIGASDYSAEVYTYDDVPGDMALEHFSIDRDRAHIAPYVKPDSRITALKFSGVTPGIGNYPKAKAEPHGVMVENGDQTVLLLVNPHTDKRQVQYCVNGTWYYFELLPDTVATVVMEA